MAYNKIVYGDQTLIDLTADDVRPEDVAKDKIFHTRDGEVAIGTSTKDSDTSDADAIATEILATKTAYVKGAKIEGTMPNLGAISGKISDLATPYSVPVGFHDGSGKVGVDNTEAAKIIPNNIKAGVSILGVVGTYGGEDIKAQTKTVTPKTVAQTILPDAGFDYISQVDVNPIGFTKTLNSAGGYTATIGE